MNPVASVWVIGLAMCAGAALQEYQVPASPKKIQLDGFLLEWNGGDARLLDTRGAFKWDAVATSEGLAGYVRLCTTDSCAAADIRIIPNPSIPSRSVRLVMQSDSIRSSLYRVDPGIGDSGVDAIAEFMVPWDSLVCDSAGNFRAGLMGVGSCGETLGVALLRGMRPTAAAGTVFTPLVRFQIMFVAVLLAIYIALMLRLKKKHPRR